MKPRHARASRGLPCAAGICECMLYLYGYSWVSRPARAPPQVRGYTLHLMEEVRKLIEGLSCCTAKYSGGARPYAADHRGHVLCLQEKRSHGRGHRTSVLMADGFWSKCAIRTVQMRPARACGICEPECTAGTSLAGQTRCGTAISRCAAACARGGGGEGEGGGGIGVVRPELRAQAPDFGECGESVDLVVEEVMALVHVRGGSTLRAHRHACEGRRPARARAQCSERSFLSALLEVQQAFTSRLVKVGFAPLPALAADGASAAAPRGGGGEDIKVDRYTAGCLLLDDRVLVSDSMPYCIGCGLKANRASAGGAEEHTAAAKGFIERFFSSAREEVAPVTQRRGGAPPPPPPRSVASVAAAHALPADEEEGSGRDGCAGEWEVVADLDDLDEAVVARGGPAPPPAPARATDAAAAPPPGDGRSEAAVVQEVWFGLCPRCWGACRR